MRLLDLEGYFNSRNVLNLGVSSGFRSFSRVALEFYRSRFRDLLKGKLKDPQGHLVTLLYEDMEVSLDLEESLWRIHTNED